MPLSGVLPIAATSCRREQSQLFGDQKGIAAPRRRAPGRRPGKAGLEVVVAAQDLHRQPGGHDLGDGGGDEAARRRPSHQLVALFVHHQHQRRLSERRDLLLGAGQSWAGGSSRAQARGDKTT